MSGKVNTEPPNVLVLCGSSQRGRPDPLFSSVRDVLVSSLDPSRYVVYPLPLPEVSRVPWRDNCRLLVVPCGLELAGEVLSEVGAFVGNGGTLLSTHPPTNASFGFRIGENFGKCRLVEIAGADPIIVQAPPKEWVVARTSLLSCENTASTLPDILSTLAQQKTTKVLARMRKVLIDNEGRRCEREGEGEREAGREGESKYETEGEGEGEGGREGDMCGVERGRKEQKDTPNVIDCIQHLQFEEHSGQAILSHVDLLSSAANGSEEPTTSLPELVALKRDAEKLSGVLQAVLREVGMECSKGESSEPTTSYLVTSDKVCVYNFLWSCTVVNGSTLSSPTSWFIAMNIYTFVSHALV